MHQKSGSSRPVSFRINLLFLQGIPTLALSKSGSRSKVTPSSQPVIQAPVFLNFINMVIHYYEFNYNRSFLEQGLKMTNIHVLVQIVAHKFVSEIVDLRVYEEI